MVLMETIREFFNTYFYLFVLILGIVVFVLTKKIIEAVNKKKMKVKFAMGNDVSKEDKGEKLSSKVLEDIFPVEAIKTLEKTDVSKEIQNVSSLILKDGEETDKGFFSEIDNLKRQLFEVKTKKEQVRGYGMELAKLHEKYQKREAYLSAIVRGMEQAAISGDKPDKH